MSHTPQTPGEAFRVRMAAERDRRGVSQRELVERLKRLGTPLHQPGIARIEAGTRKVSLDEAVAIAAALRLPVERLYAYASTPTWEEHLVMQAEMSQDELDQELAAQEAA